MIEAIYSKYALLFHISSIGHRDGGCGIFKFLVKNIGKN